jgi:hypothetical protein
VATPLGDKRIVPSRFDSGFLRLQCSAYSTFLSWGVQQARHLPQRLPRFFEGQTYSSRSAARTSSSSLVGNQCRVSGVCLAT